MFPWQIESFHGSQCLFKPALESRIQRAFDGVQGLGHSPEEIAAILRQQSINGSLMLQRHMDEIAVFDEKLRQLSTLPRYQPELFSLTRPEVRQF